MSPTGQGRKAVFVDGISAHKMKKPLGIDLFNLFGLYRLLVQKVGSCRTLACPAFVTVNPELCDGGTGLAKQLTGAGFRVLPAKSNTGEDDEVIIQHISELDPSHVSEIVIMSSDRDYVPELLAKVSQGVRVHWVATKRSVTGGENFDLSHDLCDHFLDGAFDFFELFDHRKEICKRWEQRQTCRDVCATGSLKLSMTYAGAIKDRIHLRERLLRLERDFPGLTFDTAR